MHSTSFLKVQAFYDTYVKELSESTDKVIRVLDIGAKVYGNHHSYAEIFKNDNIEYVGLDLEEGQNVDIVPSNVFIWNEIENESFDFCISGQTFEHNPFFWITYAEIARVLKQDGKSFIIAPGRGSVHRYPVDCWRFYPDSWKSLCTYTGLTLVENLFEDYQFNRVEDGADWCDSCAIASKPDLSSQSDSIPFYEQLAKITSTLPSNFAAATIPNDRSLTCLKSYKTRIESSFFVSLRRRLRYGLFERIFNSM